MTVTAVCQRFEFLKKISLFLPCQSIYFFQDSDRIEKQKIKGGHG